MALNDTFIKNSSKHRGKSTEGKHTNGGSIHLRMKASRKYWRMHHRFTNKRKTLGVHLEVSLASAHKRHARA